MFERPLVCVSLIAVLVAACSKEPQPAPAPAPAAPAPSASAAVVVSAPAARTALLAAGDPAPAIEAIAHNGQQVKLADHKGKVVVVYFYPKDDTPGCTVEAQGIRDDWGAFRGAGAVVLGVSTDDNVSHRAFAAKHELPFLLLPDTNHAIAGAFGVPVQGGHAKRVTFVIDKAGKIAKVFPAVTPAEHSKELLSVIEALKG